MKMSTLICNAVNEVSKRNNGLLFQFVSDNIYS